MVYIHGGAYESGAANNNRPEVLVARSNASVVVVTLNYRLNAFGFLGTKALRDRSVDGSVGNFGIQDQRLALAWVRDNIVVFGGNGEDITIFGESAGGNSVLNHLTQSLSFGLYSKAIIESGTYDGTPPLSVAEGCYSRMLHQTHCTDLNCLLRLNAVKLVRAARSLNANPRPGRDPLCQWGPVIDGVALRAYPQDSIARGDYNKKVPVLIGSNRDEDALWAASKHAGGIPFNLTNAQLDALFLKDLPELRPASITKMKQLYDPSSYQYPPNLGNYSQPWWTAMRIATDGGDPARRALGHCTVRYTARLLLQGGSPVVYVYHFAHPSQAVLPDINVGSTVTGTGPGSPLVPHASELPYVFGLVDVLASRSEAQLAIAMSAYWSSFARSNDPNLAGLPVWPRYDSIDDHLLHLDTEPGGIFAQKHLRESACNFWDSHMNLDTRLWIAGPVYV